MPSPPLLMKTLSTGTSAAAAQESVWTRCPRIISSVTEAALETGDEEADMVLFGWPRGGGNDNNRFPGSPTL